MVNFAACARLGVHLSGIRPTSVQFKRVNCATFSAVGDTRGSTYLIFYCFLNSSRPPLSRRLYEPETLLESAALVTLSTIGLQRDSTAKAALSLERSCPINSMAPVLAIVSARPRWRVCEVSPTGPSHVVTEAIAHFSSVSVHVQIKNANPPDRLPSDRLPSDRGSRRSASGSSSNRLCLPSRPGRAEGSLIHNHACRKRMTKLLLVLASS